MIQDGIAVIPLANDVQAGRATGNVVSIQVQNNTGAALARVVATVSVPCGGTPDRKGPFLIADDREREGVRVRYQVPPAPTEVDLDFESGNGSGPGTPDDRSATDACSWVLTDGVTIPPQGSLVLSVKDFTASTCADAGASIALVVRGRRQDQARTTLCDMPIAVTPQAAEQPAIRYFDVSPDYVLHGGDEQVRLSCAAAGVETLTLFKNNISIGERPVDGAAPVRFDDRPSITSVYRLEATVDRKVVAIEQRTVHVAQPGWNRQTHPGGYPTLLVAKGSKLYGIFVDPATGVATLWSSVSGFSGWQQEECTLPPGMIESPGVVAGDRLWLIGGSSVDPAARSNEVYYYDQGSEPAKWERCLPAGFSARMGHACVAFLGEIWVLGGYASVRDGLKQAVNDVWSFNPETEVWTNRGAAEWTRRCMFAAAVTPAVGSFLKPRLWIYGGTQNPDNPESDAMLWFTEDGRAWQHQRTLELPRPEFGKPLGATLLFDELDGRLMLAGSFWRPETADSAGTLSAHAFRLHPDRFLWEDNPVSWGWEQFGGNFFLIRSVVFNRFFFFWSLYQDIQERAPRINIFIPS